MENIIDYVGEYGKYTFEERPLNEVDSLVLCQFVYLNFGPFVPGLNEKKDSVSIQEIYVHPDRDRILEDYWYKENNQELFAKMAQSKRFSSLKMNYYENIIDAEDETQFSAMTYFLEDGKSYIAYRGTDATMVGWKEDLNMAFSKPLHSQQLGAEYLDKAANRIEGDFYAGGHSKGGNLAVYAAMNCKGKTRKKLLHVYNHDGPGFRPEIRQQGNYEAIADRVSKFIPRSSLVGMILEDHNDFEVVESRGIGPFQHNAYNWKCKEASFVRAKNMSNIRLLRDASFNEWVLSLSEEETHIFVDTLYEVISASEASTLFEFSANLKKSFQDVVEAAKDVDEDTKKRIQKMFHSLFEIAAGKLAEKKQEQG